MNRKHTIHSLSFTDATSLTYGPTALRFYPGRMTCMCILYLRWSGPDQFIIINTNNSWCLCCHLSRYHHLQTYRVYLVQFCSLVLLIKFKYVLYLSTFGRQLCFIDNHNPQFYRCIFCGLIIICAFKYTTNN